MADENDHDKLIEQGVIIKTQGEDIAELKRDKKAGIVMILGLVAKSFFDHLTKGSS